MPKSLKFGPLFKLVFCALFFLCALGKASPEILASESLEIDDPDDEVVTSGETTEADATEMEVVRLPVPVSPLFGAIDLQYGPIPYKNYSFRPGVGTGSRMSQGVRLGFEWIPFSTVGKIGIGLGVAFTVLQDVQTAEDLAANERRYATLYTVPVDLSLIYRFDYSRRQILVPFVKFGADATLVRQGSQSGGATQTGSAFYLGYDYGVGLALNFNAVDPSSAAKLDSQFGINNTYLVAEWINSRPFREGREPNLSYEAFRLGLRFEM